MKHVALLLPGLDRIGGAERQVLVLAKGLRRRGWRISMVVLSGSGAAASGLAESGIAWHSLGMRKGLAAPRGWLRFHRWLRGERPDIVHAHLPHAAWLARWSRLAAPIPVLVDTLHSSWTGGLGRRLGYRLSRQFPDCVTAVSHAAASAHFQARMIAAGRLAVVPNAVDGTEWHPDPSARAGLRCKLGLGGAFAFLAAGRLESVKNYPNLLDAMTGVKQPTRLLIAGEGSRREELTALAARLGLSDRVRFLGFQPDLRPWMQAADAFVLASRWEGLPVALLEAAACALPAIATDVPGSREAIVEGETGWLVPSGDPEALAEAMNRLAGTSLQRREEMGQSARCFAVARFGLETVLDRWEALYDGLLAGTRPAISRMWPTGCADASLHAPAACATPPDRHTLLPPDRGATDGVPQEPDPPR
ncbi:MAG: glycosyltransferase [Acidobacteriota bacterium]